MTKTSYEKLRTKILGIIEGLMLNDDAYFDVRRAIIYAEKVHCNSRKDGSKEFSHQLEMLSLALGLHDLLISPREVYLAIIVHDTIEDYPMETETMLAEFPDAILYSNRLAKFVDRDCAKGEKRYYTYFDNIGSCEVCSVVKLIDRIHNLSTAPGVFSIEKISEYVDEVEQYFVPMYKKAKGLFNQRSAYEVLKSMLMIQCRTIRSFVSIIETNNNQKYPQEVLDYVKNN